MILLMVIGICCCISNWSVLNQLTADSWYVILLVSYEAYGPCIFFDVLREWWRLLVNRENSVCWGIWAVVEKIERWCALADLGFDICRKSWNPEMEDVLLCCFMTQILALAIWNVELLICNTVPTGNNRLYYYDTDCLYCPVSQVIDTAPHLLLVLLLHAVVLGVCSWIIVNIELILRSCHRYCAVNDNK